jgi:hypothetical protein
MTNAKTRTIAARNREAVVWAQSYDGQTHYRDVLKALAPAFFILTAAAALMLIVF